MLGKPTAALSSSLLARKGHARPAMRPQGFVSLTPPAHEDLGWNDMGEEPVAPAAPEVSPVLRMRAELEQQITPVEPAPEPVAEIETPAVVAEPEPEAPAVAVAPEPEPPAAAPRTSSAKAAFTLRLDPERHLRLRLASAVRHTSAQHLVTEALDAFLESLNEVDALVRELEAQERNG